MSLYVGTSNSTVADLVASHRNVELIKRLLQTYYSPLVGSVKFLARSNLHNNEIQGISHYDGSCFRIKSGVDFLGWVVADGSFFSAEDFKSTQGMFDVQNGIFKVPDLRHFYKIDNTQTSISSDQCQVCQMMFDSSHQHPITCNIEITKDEIIRNCLSCATTSNTTEGGAILQRSSIKYKNDGTVNYSNLKTMTSPVVSSAVPASTAVGPQLSDLCESDGRYIDAIPVAHNGSTASNAISSILTAPIVMTDNTNIGELNVGEFGAKHPNCYPRNIKLIPMIYIGAVLA